MKYFNIILIFSIVLISCKTPDKKKRFTLNGTISGDTPKMIYLEYDNIKDSSAVINNRFKFKGQTSDFTEAGLTTDGVSAFLEDYIYLENTEIDLRLNIVKKKAGEIKYNLISVDTIIGTKTALIRNDFNNLKTEIGKDSTKTKLLTEKVKSIIDQNPSNDFSSYLLSDYAKKFEPKELKSLFNRIDTTSIPNYRLEELKRLVNPNHDLKIGSKIADFKLKDVNDNVINTKDLRGKLVLIDFWASWCTPCRKKHPKLKEIYREYEMSDFEILSVSVDTDLEKWKRALRQDRLPWFNVIENKGFKGKVATRYEIMALPSTFLINKDGIIVDVDISLEDLEFYLSRYK